MLNTCKWSDEPGFGLGQSRERVSNTWVTCPEDRDNPRKLGLIPDVVRRPHDFRTKGGNSLGDGLAAYQLVGGVTAYQDDDG